MQGFFVSRVTFVPSKKLRKMPLFGVILLKNASYATFFYEVRKVIAMFIKKVQSVIWMQRPYNGDGRRDFKATYVFDDGFLNIQSCIDTLQKLGYEPKNFAFVSFCDQWYAVNINSYNSYIIVSADNLFFPKGQFEPGHHSISKNEWNKSRLPAARFLMPDRKRWADGIVHDMMSIDQNITVFTTEGMVSRSSILFNNIVITLGREYFTTEICIRSADYIQHVFGNYYSQKSMSYMMERIAPLMRAGYQYYNPFTGVAARDKKESDQHAKESRRGLPAVKNNEVIMIPENADGVKVVRKLYSTRFEA